MVFKKRSKAFLNFIFSIPREEKVGLSHIVIENLYCTFYYLINLHEMFKEYKNINI